jgi:hypothetical protein
MQDDDKSRRRLEMIRHERKHPERAGIGTEAGDLGEWTMESWLEASPVIRKAVETRKPLEPSQKFNIVGKRHRQLLGERYSHNLTENR